MCSVFNLFKKKNRPYNSFWDDFVILRTNFNELLELLKKEEGFSKIPYLDGDHWTEGYGTTVRDLRGKPLPIDHVFENYEICEYMADHYLKQSVMRFLDELDSIFKKEAYAIPKHKKIALVNMIFNLGTTRFLKFKKMIKAIKKGNWAKAANEIMIASDGKSKSTWATTHPARTKRVYDELVKYRTLN